MQHKQIIVIFITLFSFAFTATGQKIINSPYSRFNLGSLEPAGSFRSQGMGGIETAMRDNNSIFFTNPASYSSLDTNSFIFDFGLDYSMSFLSERDSAYSSDDMNFDHLLIGFPIKKGWGIAAGIVPVSNGYFKMTGSVSATDPNYDPLVGTYSSFHVGEGGYSKFFLGSGVKINKNFSLGINMTLLFGQVKRLNQFDFDETKSVFNNNSNEKIQINGISFDYGIQYMALLKNDYFLNAGVSLSTRKHYKSKYDYISFKYTTTSAKDTISLVTDDSSSTIIPGTFRLGISLGKINKFTAGLDFVYTRWSNSRILGANGYAADTRALLFGAELIPDKFSNYSFLKRLEYRIGAHVENNYLVINGEQVKEFGASCGIGLPLRRSMNKINLFFDFTKKYGASGSNLLTENYYTMGVSLNFHDFWFLKQKYD